MIMSNERRHLQTKRFSAEIDAEINNFFPTKGESYMQVGEKGYVIPAKIGDGLNDIHNLAIRPDDVFIATFPRSGTTMTQELVWLILNDCDFETVKSIPLTDRYVFLEFPLIVGLEMSNKLQESVHSRELQKKLQGELGMYNMEELRNISSRRFIKTHLSLSILPPELLDTAKVVYVARDPRDVCVSLYHLTLMMRKLYGFTGDFKDFWSLFKRDLLLWTPFFTHVKEAWEKRNHPNILFMFYEEMLQDMPSVIHRLLKFYGKTVTEEQMQALCEHVKFENFSKNKKVQLSALEEIGMLQEGEKFIRKGKAGGWREYFDEDMSQEAEYWIEENLRDTDLRFPQVSTAASDA